MNPYGECCGGQPLDDPRQCARRDAGPGLGSCRGWGSGAFSIRDVAAATGVSVGTVTYHFANRERLVDEAFAALAQRHDTIARVAITSARTGTRDEARTTLVYALHHLWGERAITLAAAELERAVQRLRGLLQPGRHLPQSDAVTAATCWPASPADLEPPAARLGS